MHQRIPENSWQLYLQTVERASHNISEILEGKPMGPLLNQFIHLIVFQQGICAARWVNNNVDLLRRLNSIQSFTKGEFDEISAEIRRSVDKLLKI